MIFYQASKILVKQYVINQFFRLVHGSQQTSNKIYPLESRKLLKISGTDAAAFLQGLITNDMKHFDEGATSMYAMFLNNKGRVLYDTIIHKWKNGNSFILECDANVVNSLQKHLKLYKLRRLIQIEDVNKDFKIWVLTSAESSAPEIRTDSKNNIYIFRDPRLTDLGFRIITSSSLKQSHIEEILGKNITFENDEGGYKYLRYKLGVSEGAEDLPPGTCFPLEVNCDYLHGVSFHKGCYIGQELTARVHHTGVVRKRIMPVKFTEGVNENLEKDTAIVAKNDSKINLGKLKGFSYDYGLGLIRIKEALDVKLLSIGKYTAEVIKPTWWPIEAPKEKIKI